MFWSKKKRPVRAENWNSKKEGKTAVGRGGKTKLAG